MDRATLEQAEVRAREIAEAIDKKTPDGWKFVVVLASVKDDPFMTYASNLERGGAIEMLRELADKIEVDR